MIIKEVSTFFIDQKLKMKFKLFSARKKTSMSKMLETAITNLMEPGRLGSKPGPGR